MLFFIFRLHGNILFRTLQHTLNKNTMSTYTLINIGTGSKKLWKCEETGKVFHGRTLAQVKAFYRKKHTQFVDFVVK